MAKMSGQGVWTHHRRVAERGLQQGSLTHFSQCFPSGQYIRIVYAIVRMELRRIALHRIFLLGSPDSIAAHVLFGNPDGVDPDSLAHSMSSGRGAPTPCTRRRSPLRSIAHSTQGRILSGRLSTFSGHFISGIPCADILHSDISHPDGRGRRFNLSGQTYPDPPVAPTQLDMHNCSVLLKLPDISDRHPETFCFRYLLSKSPKSPCNPPIIGFLSL